ncbi:olfactory receptor class A-like protein 1 [Cyprinodon tularosa]|uniref:olfactory receptor class A-like protein 1 n=1 Tax=Cyprinodon tularosa TaxID=77115 RepID=UPI0018E25FE7|nr:olfactory receptor class A-like protein 1 [Cyprinodon tularosa]
MASDKSVRGMLFLSLTVVGVPGNIAVIVAFLLLIRQESLLLAADAIVLHLACANLLVVLVRCLLEMLASFRQVNVFGDIGCKTVIFIYRTSRALSIWLTFLLSAYQCLCIAPPGSSWASTRALVAQNLFIIFIFLWILHTSMSVGAIVFSVSSKNHTTPTTSAVNTEFCYVNFPSDILKEGYGAVQVSRDVVPIVLMTLSSLIILVLLYKHSQHLKGLRGAGQAGSGSSGAEQRAAKVVVVLVTMYVVLYGVDNGLWVYTLTVRQTMRSSLISDLRVFFASLYAALSPLVIIASNRKVNSRLRCVAQEKPLQGKTARLCSI